MLLRQFSTTPVRFLHLQDIFFDPFFNSSLKISLSAINSLSLSHSISKSPSAFMNLNPAFLLLHCWLQFPHRPIYFFISHWTSLNSINIEHLFHSSAFNFSHQCIWHLVWSRIFSFHLFLLCCFSNDCRCIGVVTIDDTDQAIDLRYIFFNNNFYLSLFLAIILTDYLNYF